MILHPYYYSSILFLMKLLRVTFLLFAMLSCTSSGEINSMVDENDLEDTVTNDSHDPNANYQLLFIGNSLTASNDLPHLIRNKYLEMGHSVSCTSMIPPGFGLEDHWNTGIIQGMISSGYYDFVIIQQGPSSQEYGRSSLIEYWRLDR